MTALLGTLKTMIAIGTSVFSFFKKTGETERRNKSQDEVKENSNSNFCSVIVHKDPGERKLNSLPDNTERPPSRKRNSQNFDDIEFANPELRAPSPKVTVIEDDSNDSDDELSVRKRNWKGRNLLTAYTDSEESDHGDKNLADQEISSPVGQSVTPVSLSNSETKKESHKEKTDWSRQGRVKRKLAESAKTCFRISDFFSPKDLKTVLQENNALHLQLESMRAAQTKKAESSADEVSGNFSVFLIALIDAAKRNAGRNIHGWRYKKVLKTVGRYAFQKGGPQVYNFFRINLPGSLPSITTLDRTFNLHKSIPVEGEIRLAELSQYLTDNNYPRTVILAEDATRIVNRVQYDSKTNQIVGFVPALLENGLPAVKSFPATSASVIKGYFEGNKVSSNAYVMMAQPLAEKAGAFCLGLFGSDNKFSAVDVGRRIQWIKFEAYQRYRITVLAVAADGDARLLKCMQNFTFTEEPIADWKWFMGPKTPAIISYQDTVHILTKLRTKLTKSSLLLPVGNYVITPAHVRQLIRQESKDKHHIEESDLSGRDKMNFRSMEKLYQENVGILMQDVVPASKGTVTYLDMARDIAHSFLDKMISPEKRINLIWRWIFFLRLWRHWLKENGYSLQDNFLTSNAYMCIEINGHAILQSIFALREAGQDNLFLPWYFSSQPCEEFFRSLRSMSTTMSTVVNFSMLEMLHRIRMHG
ncbi:hypothetical protein FOCC_FOCC014722 [Frankliniella occidentalis]|nr:hypothetical protein FOCC_FOCC014722 [Frankliniella occidentalis]